MCRGDSSVPLLGTRIPRFVLQERQCSVHAAGGFLPLWRRLCAVNVKLTMRLGIGGRLLVSAQWKRSPVVSKWPVRLLHRRRQTVWSARGEGWGCRPGSLREKRPAQTREGFLRALPFSLVSCGPSGDPVLAPYRQAAYWGAIARESHRPRPSTPLESPPQYPEELPQDARPEPPREPLLTLPGPLTAYLLLLAAIPPRR